MTIYQEAHRKIDQFPEETVYLFIQLMDNMRVNPDQHLQNKKLNRFMETAGKIDIDDEAVTYLREASMI